MQSRNDKHNCLRMNAGLQLNGYFLWGVFFSFCQNYLSALGIQIMRNIYVLSTTSHDYLNVIYIHIYIYICDVFTCHACITGTVLLKAINRLTHLSTQRVANRTQLFLYIDCLFLSKKGAWFSGLWLFLSNILNIRIADKHSKLYQINEMHAVKIESFPKIVKIDQSVKFEVISPPPNWKKRQYQINKKGVLVILQSCPAIRLIRANYDIECDMTEDFIIRW